MKPIILIIACFCILSVQAQTSGTKATLNDKSLVKDSSGMIYPYAIWQRLYQTGEYGIRLLNAASDPQEFLLYRFSEEQMKAREASMPKPRESTFFRTGNTLRSVKMVTMDGKKYNLKELTGKVVVLNFWFINCPPCRMEIPHLNKMTDGYKNREDIVFLAIALDQSYELKEFLKELPFNYGIVDGGGYIAEQYGVKAFPTHVVLDKEGKITFHTMGYGAGTVPWLKKSIDAALGPQALGTE